MISVSWNSQASESFARSWEEFFCSCFRIYSRADESRLVLGFSEERSSK